MPRKEFEAFTRLDALDINTYLMDQAVMTFATSVARDTAIPTPTNGISAYLQDSDTLTVYDGTAWTLVGGQSLELINSTSFSAVAAQQLDNVFSDTYENYKIIINITVASVSSALLQLRMASGGTVDSTASRYETGVYTVGARNTVAAASANSSAAAQARLGRVATDVGCGAEVNMYNPFITTNTKFTCISAGNTLDASGAGLIVTDSYDGFQIFPSSGTITGTIHVYGIRES